VTTLLSCEDSQKVIGCSKPRITPCLSMLDVVLFPSNVKKTFGLSLMHTMFSYDHLYDAFVYS